MVLGKSLSLVIAAITKVKYFDTAASLDAVITVVSLTILSTVVSLTILSTDFPVFVIS